jgi:hypothetical protein
MAKIVNIQLLVNAIADGLNDALRSIVHPMGSGYAQDSFILDYKLANLDAAVPATTEVEQDIANGSYEESAAFQEISDNTHAAHHYLLHIEEDVEPNLIGPFDNEAALLAKAIEVNTHSPDDGLFRVTADKASKIEVDAFTCGDLRCILSGRGATGATGNVPVLHLLARRRRSAGRRKPHRCARAVHGR